MLNNIKKINGDKRFRLSVWFMGITMVLVSVMFCFFIWSIFIDGDYVRKPVIYWDGSFKVLDCPCRPGSEIRVTLFATKNTDEIARIHWILVNNQTGQTWSYAIRYGALLRGYRAITSPPLTLPKDIPPGIYHLSGTAQYDISPFKTISYPMRSTDFDVVSLKGAGFD